jgi:DNA helicase-2/ATP-dependent DNA helicase PcrA
LIGDGMRASEIAVLVRINAMTRGYEEALAAAGVPFQLRGTERFFDRPEVKQVVTLLRVAARSAGPDEDPASAVRPVLTGLGLTAQPPGGRGGARERWESLEALAAFSTDFFAITPGATLSDLVAELEQRIATGHVPESGGVTLASLHAAKGLEWDAVFLPGLTDGTMPIVYAQSAEAIDEERRLLYVGITRARERVFLSWSLARTRGGTKNRKPSRFLDEMRGKGRPV